MGQGEKSPIGAKLLKDSLGNGLNLVLDGYVVTDNNSSNLTEVVGKEKGNIIPGMGLMRESKTDLGFWEYLRMWVGNKRSKVR